MNNTDHDDDVGWVANRTDTETDVIMSPCVLFFFVLLHFVVFAISIRSSSSSSGSNFSKR